MGSIKEEDIRAGIAEGIRLYLENHHEEMKRMILEAVADIWIGPMNENRYEGFGVDARSSTIE